MKQVRMGIVGLGAQGGLYASMLTGVNLSGHAMGRFEKGMIPNMVLGAICDNDPAKKALAAEKLPDVPFFDNYIDMLESGLIDSVVTTLPHYEHTVVATEALNRGIHALCEKPAGVYAKQVRELNELAASKPNLTFAIMFNQRANPLYRKLKEIVDSKELGNLRRANWIITTWWRPQGYYDQSAWRATWGGEGGGVLVNQAPHQIDLMQWICGMPKKVYSNCKYGFQRDIVVEDEVTAMFDYGNGATGVFITCTHDVLGTDRFEMLFDGGKIVVDNSRRAVVKRLNKPENVMNKEMSMRDVASIFMGGKSDSLMTEEVIDFTADGAAFSSQHATVLEEFAAHILEGKPLVAQGFEGINGVQVANAIHLSSWLGKEVELPVDEDLYVAELNKKIAEEGKYPAI